MDQAEDGHPAVQVQRSVRDAERSRAAQRDGRLHQGASGFEEAVTGYQVRISAENPKRGRHMKFLGLTCIFAAVLFGQSADTGILGSVTDQSGSVIVGAAVTISNQAIGFSKSVVTGADGQYEM